jgi:hypothetical protein
MPIFIEKGISGESKVNLQYLIINQPVLTSPIEKVEHFGLGRTHCADRDTCRTSEAETTTRTGQRTTASDDLEPRGMTQRLDITPGDHVRSSHFHASVPSRPKSVTSHHAYFCDGRGQGVRREYQLMLRMASADLGSDAEFTAECAPRLSRVASSPRGAASAGGGGLVGRGRPRVGKGCNRYGGSGYWAIG